MADPPACIRGKPKPATVIETLDRLDEPNVALLNEVDKRHATMIETTGNGDDEPQVRFHECIFGRHNRVSRRRDLAEMAFHARPRPTVAVEVCWQFSLGQGDLGAARDSRLTQPIRIECGQAFGNALDLTARQLMTRVRLLDLRT